MKPFNMFKRAVSGLALVSVGVMAIGVLPAAAAGATLGQAVTDGLACPSGGFSGVQAETAKGVPSYIVPGGVTQIASWSTEAGADGGSIALEIWQPTSSPQAYTLVGISPTETLTASMLNTFVLASPIAVQKGDALGLYVANTTDCSATVSGSQTADLALGTFSEASPPTVGTQIGFGQTLWGAEWNISAVGAGHHQKA
jgi:hypothetical protein